MDAFHLGQPVSCALVLSHSNSLTWLTGTFTGRNSINVIIHTCAVFCFDVFKCRLWISLRRASCSPCYHLFNHPGCSYIFNGQIWEWYRSSHLTLGKGANKIISQNVKPLLFKMLPAILSENRSLRFSEYQRNACLMNVLTDSLHVLTNGVFKT